MGNVFCGGNATPELSFALTKALLSSVLHYCIAFSTSAISVVLECSLWDVERGTEVQAGKGREVYSQFGLKFPLGV